MQPRTPRSYALAVPAGDDPRKTLVPLYMDIHAVHGGATVQGRLLHLTTAPSRPGVHSI